MSNLEKEGLLILRDRLYPSEHFKVLPPGSPIEIGRSIDVPSPDADDRTLVLLLGEQEEGSEDASLRWSLQEAVSWLDDRWHADHNAQLQSSSKGRWHYKNTIVAGRDDLLADFSRSTLDNPTDATVISESMQPNWFRELNETAAQTKARLRARVIVRRELPLPDPELTEELIQYGKMLEEAGVPEWVAQREREFGQYD